MGQFVEKNKPSHDHFPIALNNNTNIIQQVVLLELGIEFRIFTDIILIASLIGLGLGYYLKDNDCHKFRMAGLFLFGLFWVLQTPYFVAIGDLFNAVVCILALPFYAYLGYHEYLSYEWNEENESLKWVAGASFLAGGLYFLIDKIPLLSGYLILGVAVQTVWLINLFGYGYGVGEINYADNPLWYRTNFNEISVEIVGSNVSIIQSCTAIQSMLIFIAAIYCVQAQTRRKWNAFFATVPIIYFLNLIRNISVIYMMDDLGWSYEFSHHTVGKGASFLALIVLAFIAFKLLPKLLDNILGIIDLKDREKKKEAGEKELRKEDESEQESKNEQESEGEKESEDEIETEEEKSVAEEED
ncbi:MAG: archaeosortase A [Methanomassiliicoccales archaeon]|nr:MAG: archaeosortase A [Methanomassiliicoccales archaeon]